MIKIEPIEHRDVDRHIQTAVVERAPASRRGDLIQIDDGIYQVVTIERITECETACERPGQYRVKFRRA